jgi:DNA-binding NarL/FixJ family response regulator
MRQILFVDDHPIYRDGVKRVLESRGSNLKVYTADGVTGALDALQQIRDIDLCLTDYRLLDGDGVVLVSKIRARYPTIAVGILCAEPTLSLVNEVRALGAIACLSKDRDPDALCDAINVLYNGGTVFDNFSKVIAGTHTLSLRRREILVFAGQGLLDKQIAEKMAITESTVRNHWQHIFIQLSVSNRTEAVSKALRQGLI